MFVQAFNLRTQEAQAGRSMSSKAAWSTGQIPGQVGLPISKIQKQTTNKMNRITDTLVLYGLYCSFIFNIMQ